jgi:trk system potassium uptake protein TrkH
MKSRAYISQIGLEGALRAFSPILFLLSVPPANSLYPVGLRVYLGATSGLLCFLCSLTICRRPFLGRGFGAGAALTGYAAIVPYLVKSPFAALVGSVCLIAVGSVLFQSDADKTSSGPGHAERCLIRAQWGASVSIITAILCAVLDSSSTRLTLYCVAATAIIAQTLFLHWAASGRSWWRVILSLICVASIVSIQLTLSLRSAVPLIILLSMASLLAMPLSWKGTLFHDDKWWVLLVNHSGRSLFITFFLLCLIGSICLYIPAATTQGLISFIDAAFTSVSAVCVTGLIVLDTPNEFSFLGQVFILVLIQLGGLGIMSITTVALHAMGMRLSLKHEKLLTSMTETSHHDLISSLAAILKYTFVLEGIGAVLLTLAFFFSGDNFSQSLWRGVFTAVSAFCNAGFALQSDNLVSYQTNPLVLHTVALLIISGGMAPATSLVMPRWLAGKTIPIAARIALVTTIVLLGSGTFFILVFEWDGVLSGLSFLDKCQNAWFQSVTLRTAGFNSVDIMNISSPTFLIMLFFMFVGGSPGGTAGGVKTTSIGILAMTFWANITNQTQIVIQNRRIHAETIYRAVTVVIAGAAIWCTVVLMLVVTQSISLRDLIFEATSAIGTVGLSTGATPLLDEIGKVIVIIAMFVGRIGPLSLFMLLNDEKAISDTRYPLERVSIT